MTFEEALTEIEEAWDERTRDYIFWINSKTLDKCREALEIVCERGNNDINSFSSRNVRSISNGYGHSCIDGGSMKAENILEVVYSLVGEVEPVGSTHIDEVRKEHLETLIKVCDGILDTIYNCTEYKYNNEWSMKEIGERADTYLKETVKWFSQL